MKRLAIILLLCSAAYAQNYLYVRPGGSGSASGANWTNAMDFPTSAPACNTIYFFAGGTYNRAASGSGVTLTNMCTDATRVQFLAAVDCSSIAAPYCASTPSGNQPQNVTGWNVGRTDAVSSSATSATNPAIFLQAAAADITTGGTQFIRVCGSGFTVDGIIPLSPPSYTSWATVTKGFVFRSPNQSKDLIQITNNGCGAMKQAISSSVVSGGNIVYSMTNALPSWVQIGQKIVAGGIGTGSATGVANQTVAAVDKVSTPNTVTIVNPTDKTNGATGGASNMYFQLQGVTIQHVELDGVQPQYGVNITACSRTSNVSTFTLQGGVPSNWATGQKVDFWGTSFNGVSTNGSSATPLCGTGTGQTASSCGTATDFSTPHASTGLALTVVDANRISVAQTGADDTCNINTGVGAKGYSGKAVLNTTPGFAISTSMAAGTSQSYDEIKITDNYIHDIPGGIAPINWTNVDIERNWFARNFGTYAQHANGVEIKDAGSFTTFGGVVCSPCTVNNNVWENYQNTQVAGFLNTPNSDGFSFSNNIAFCADNIDASVPGPNWPQCGVSRLSGDNNGACSTNTKIVGNTVYDGKLNTSIGGIGYLKSCSTVLFQNNLILTNAAQVLSMGSSHTTNAFNNTVLGTSGYAALSSGLDANNNYQNKSAISNTTTPFGCNPACQSGTSVDFNLGNATYGVGGASAWLHMTDGLGLTNYLTDINGASRGSASGAVTRGGQAFGTPPFTIEIDCAGGNGSVDTVAHTITMSCAGIVATCTHGTPSGTNGCIGNYSAASNETLTETPSGGYGFIGWGGAFSGSSSTYSLANIQQSYIGSLSWLASPTCSLTCASNNVNILQPVSCTATLANLTGTWYWSITEPLAGQQIVGCNTAGCQSGSTANLPYTGSGIYTLSAIANGVPCTSSTQPLNVNTPAAGAVGH